MKIITLTLVCISLRLLVAPAMAEAIWPPLPAEVTLNQAAGRKGMLMVTIRLESGEELPFMVDTGSPVTLLSKSLEAKLGDRLGVIPVRSMNGSQQSGRYAAPKLFLGDTPLVTGTNIFSYDFSQLSSQAGNMRGIIGMDCLRHYCVQLDFEAGKMRFLAADRLDAAELGKAYPLIFSGEGQGHPNALVPVIHQPGLLAGTSTNSLIDTGFNVDGLVEKATVQGNFGTRFIHFLISFRALRLPECVWDGEHYTNIMVAPGPNGSRNILGLRFLARHLVTMDFPGKTLYLKKTNSGPLPAGESAKGKP